MTVIIAGSRRVHDAEIVAKAVASSGFGPITAIFSGCSRGIDLAGEEWANSQAIPIIHMPYVGHLGKAGGPVRNQQMVDFADALLALPDALSRGTLDIIKAAEKRRILVYVYAL